MVILIVVMHVIVCLFLIAVILLQAGRGQGLSWGVFGGTPQSILGTKTATFLSRVTTACAIIFLFTCIALNIIETRKSRSLVLPQSQGSQLDFSKIKQALEEAEKAQPIKTEATVNQVKEEVKAEVQEVQKTVEPEVPAIPAAAIPAATIPSSENQ